MNLDSKNGWKQRVCVIWLCSHEVLWFDLRSGHVPVRQPDPELLLPQRGSDRPETSRDGVEYLLVATLFLWKSPSAYFKSAAPAVYVAAKALHRKIPTDFMLCLSFRLRLSSKTAWWNSWRSSCPKSRPTCAVLNPMMPSSQVQLYVLMNSFGFWKLPQFGHKKFRLLVLAHSWRTMLQKGALEWDQWVTCGS